MALSSLSACLLSFRVHCIILVVVSVGWVNITLQHWFGYNIYIYSVSSVVLICAFKSISDHKRCVLLNWRKGSPQETRPEWENSSLHKSKRQIMIYVIISLVQVHHVLSNIHVSLRKYNRFVVYYWYSLCSCVNIKTTCRDCRTHIRAIHINLRNKWALWQDALRLSFIYMMSLDECRLASLCTE